VSAVSISTHVLDTGLGRPAAAVPVSLEREVAANEWRIVGRGETDADGRVRSLLAPGTTLSPGIYRLVFDTRSYFAKRGVAAFYPVVQVVFETQADSGHYHVPLLLSPFGYSTYRGS
jgi:5-hydroxyisourate hydrolase